VAQRDWEVLDGYWGERAEIVLDQDRRWVRARFEPTDAVRLQGTAGVWLRPVSDDDEGAATPSARAFQRARRLAEARQAARRWSSPAGTMNTAPSAGRPWAPVVRPKDT
jgi:hypothetical protein